MSFLTYLLQWLQKIGPQLSNLFLPPNLHVKRLCLLPALQHIHVKEKESGKDFQRAMSYQSCHARHNSIVFLCHCSGGLQHFRVQRPARDACTTWMRGLTLFRVGKKSQRLIMPVARLRRFSQIEGHCAVIRSCLETSMLFVP